MASEDFDPGSVPRDFRLPDGSELTSHLRHTGRAPEREILAELYDVCGERTGVGSKTSESKKHAKEQTKKLDCTGLPAPPPSPKGVCLKHETAPCVRQTLECDY